MSILVGNANQKILKRKSLRDHYKLDEASQRRSNQNQQRNNRSRSRGELPAT